jgi:hypothetical protein
MVAVGAARQQQLDHAGVTARGGVHQRRVAGFAGRIRPGPAVQQQGDDFRLAGHRCDHQRRLPAGAARFGSDAAIERGPRRGDVAAADCRQKFVIARHRRLRAPFPIPRL